MRLLAVTGMVLLVASCAGTRPGGPAAPAAAPVVSLFDGTSLAGWQGDAAIWSVKDGAIDGSTMHGGFLLYTSGDYDDFRLVFQSRLVSEGNHLGVCFWGERRADYKYGRCVLVIPPDGGMWDYILNKTPPREKIPHDPPFDPHQWHTTEILAHRRTGEVQVAVDGFQTTRYRDVDAARLKKGPIGLQIHGGASEVQYKDLRVEVSPAEDRLITVAPFREVTRVPPGAGEQLGRPQVLQR
jgi:hypothetical protein